MKIEQNTPDWFLSMRKLILTISILVLSTPLAWVASAQGEARKYRLGFEYSLSRFVNGNGHFGAGLYLTDKLGITAGLGSYYDDIAGEYSAKGAYSEIGAVYYFDGVANSSEYIHGYVRHWDTKIRIIHTTFTSVYDSISDVHTTTQNTAIEQIGEVAWTNFGVIFGHRWQGKRWFLRTGLGYAESRDIEFVVESTNDGEEKVILNSHDGRERTLDKSVFVRGFISNIAIGIAF